MTLGTYTPAMTGLGCLLLAVRALAGMSALPARTALGYDPARHPAERRGMLVALAAALALPPLLWLALNRFSDLGAMELF